MFVRFFVKNFNVWYVGFEIFIWFIDVYCGDDGLWEMCVSVLSELYVEFCEEDMYYGVVCS